MPGCGRWGAHCRSGGRSTCPGTALPGPCARRWPFWEGGGGLRVSACTWRAIPHERAPASRPLPIDLFERAGGRVRLLPVLTLLPLHPPPHPPTLFPVPPPPPPPPSPLVLPSFLFFFFLFFFF